MDSNRIDFKLPYVYIDQSKSRINSVSNIDLKAEFSRVSRKVEKHRRVKKDIKESEKMSILRHVQGEPRAFSLLSFQACNPVCKLESKNSFMRLA